MSFRLFVYYSALIGAWMAFAGWALGRQFAPQDDLAEAGVKGLLLGLLVAFGLGLVDALWDVSLYRFGTVLVRVLTGVLIGSVGGLVGGVIGQWFYRLTELSLFRVVGWTITGLLIGLSVGVFEALTRLLSNDHAAGAVRKVRNGLVGGALGGVLGGLLTLALHGLRASLFRDKPEDQLWSPSALGFVAIGLCIGLLVGVARVILREAWVRVEQGRRAGREQILSRPEITIGRAESCDIGLFGDNAIDRLHARIQLQGTQYLLVDVGTPGGTYLNGERIDRPTPLRAGDLIRVGKAVLRFGERQKRPRE